MDSYSFKKNNEKERKKKGGGEDKKIQAKGWCQNRM